MWFLSFDVGIILINMYFYVSSSSHIMYRHIHGINSESISTAEENNLHTQTLNSIKF